MDGELNKLIYAFRNKKNRVVDLYNMFLKAGQNEFPFNDKNISGGLNMYFGKPPTYTLFVLNDIIGIPIFVGINTP